MYIIGIVLVLIFIVYAIGKSNDKSKVTKSQKITEDTNTKQKLFMVFDTETDGVSPEDNDILQLSYQIVYRNTYKTFKEVNEFFPWPEDKSRVQMGAINVNGLTEEYLATKKLSDRKGGIKRFFDDMRRCEFIVAHNGEFDKKFIMATANRCGVSCSDSQWPMMIDTMKTTVDLCQLPPKPGKTGYKWPKLIELAQCLRIKTSDINLHDSSADVELTKRCFVYLLKQKFYNIK